MPELFTIIADLIAFFQRVDGSMQKARNEFGDVINLRLEFSGDLGSDVEILCMIVQLCVDTGEIDV